MACKFCRKCLLHIQYPFNIQEVSISDIKCVHSLCHPCNICTEISFQFGRKKVLNIIVKKIAHDFIWTECFMASQLWSTRLCKMFSSSGNLSMTRPSFIINNEWYNFKILEPRYVTYLNLGTTFHTTENSASGECVTPPPCHKAHSTLRNSSTTDL